MTTKKQFTTAELIDAKGCYSLEELKSCSFYKEDSIIKVKDILNSEIPLIDKSWFVYNECNVPYEVKGNYALPTYAANADDQIRDQLISLLIKMVYDN